MSDQPYHQRVARRIFGQPKLYIILGAAAITLAQNPLGPPALWYVIGAAFLGIAVWRFVAR